MPIAPVPVRVYIAEEPPPSRLIAFSAPSAVMMSASSTIV